MRVGKRILTTALAAVLGGGALAAAPPDGVVTSAPAGPLFATADRCIACHNGLVASNGADVSIGSDWRASMMASAARDPYWQAAVRRETLDHPEAAGAIENECSACHMPMARFEARASGRQGEVFAHLPIGAGAARADLLAADGVSCSICHQVEGDNFGSEESFTAGFLVDTTRPPGERRIFGPFEVDRGRRAIMRSASGFDPAASSHVQSSELCATCHTLFTHSLGPGGAPIGVLPEQVPYLEWRHSAYAGERSCQSCHMPEAPGEAPIAAVLSDPRPGFSRHVFRGGNFFVLRMLERYGQELGVAALPRELATAAERTVENLQTRAARLAIDRVAMAAGRLEAEVAVESLAGHKLPSAYPSRRAWIHFTVRDGSGRPVFESGALDASGRIVGNDNDADGARYEPHHEVIEAPEQVQIYETILAGPDGAVTTGLLTATVYAKDNRLLPRGFDKAQAPPEVAVHGPASKDADFRDGGDRVRYSVDVEAAALPLSVEAELLYQPIGYRWAENLRPYGAPETERFVRYFESMADASAVALARTSVTVP